ncbi:MAG: hypothetical protein ABI923_03145 [bacterium]
MDRKQNVYGNSKIPPNRSLQKSDAKQLKHPPQQLDARKRKVVENAVREVCEHRQYILRAINVRTNHVHTVVAAAIKERKNALPNGRATAPGIPPRAVSFQWPFAAN